MSDLASFLSSSFREFANPPPPRLQSLYSDIFRQKQSNPEGYVSSLAWWTRTLESIVASQRQPHHSSDVLVFHASDELISALRWEKVGRPLGIGAVVADLLSNDDLIPLSNFLTSSLSIYAQPSIASKLASYIFVTPLHWAMERLSLSGDGAGSPSGSQVSWSKVKGNYVFKSILEKAGEAVISHFLSKTNIVLSDSLYSVETFKSEFASVALPGVTLSDLDLRVLLLYLERDKGVIVTEPECVKFLKDPESSQEISEVDKSIVEIKSVIRTLEDQVEEIGKQLHERMAKAKLLISQKNKDRALVILKSRKRLEELQIRRLTSLETLQTVLEKMDSAAGDIEIMNAYEASAQSLRSILSHPSLRVENIEEVTRQLSDELANHKEIEEAIQLGNAGLQAAVTTDQVADDEDIAAQLDKLVQEETERQRIEKEASALAEAKRPPLEAVSLTGRIEQGHDPRPPQSPLSHPSSVSPSSLRAERKVAEPES